MKVDIFYKLLKEAGESDSVELKMVHDGRDKAMKSYTGDPGKKTKEDFDAARLMYDETIERFVRKYLPDNVPEPEGERFVNRKQALNWLKGQGYQISQGKFYGDCNDGFPLIHKDKTISRFHVLQYGQQLQADKNTAPDNSRIDELKERKLKLEVEKIEKENRAEDRKWMKVEDAWASIATILGDLQDSLRHQFHTGQGGLIHLAGGDQARAPELHEGCEELIAAALNEVCNKEKIEGIFEQDDQQ